MQEIFEKIKERLEKERHPEICGGWETMRIDRAIGIVNQVAEEFSNSEIPNKSENLTCSDVNVIFDILDQFHMFQGQRAGRELWADKPKAVRDIDIANYNRNLQIIRNFIQENIDWIPCNVRLPEKEGNYLVSYGKDTYVFVESFNGKWFDEHFYFEQPKAWMHCPEPYQPKGEK